MFYDHTTPPLYHYLLATHTSTGPSPSCDATATTPNGIRHDNQPRSYSSAAWTDDIEMGWDGEYEETAHLLAIDTNILISHLPLVQAMYRLLDPLASSPLTLLIPSVVLSELDGLKSSPARCSDKPHTTVGECARAATTWMLNVNRARRETGKTRGGVLRGQRWVERLHQDRTKGDDRILDCCLYFRNSHSGTIAGVTLWTNDRNLSLLAETEDIVTIGAGRMTIAGIINATGIELPEEAWKRVPELHAGLLAGKAGTNEQRRENIDDGLMDMDEDLQVAEADQAEHGALPSVSSSQTESSLSVNDIPIFNLGESDQSIAEASTPTTRPSTDPTRPLTADIQRLRHSLDLALTRIIDTIIAHPEVDVPRIDHEPAQQLLAILGHLETAISTTSTIDIDVGYGITPQRQSVLRAISSIRTIDLFFYVCDKKRRPRTGEVSDALDILGNMLSDLGLPEEVWEPLRGMAEEFRCI